METTISTVASEDREAIMNIFNYYVENSFAAYPERKLPYESFDGYLNLSTDLPAVSVKNEKGEVVGFGMLRFHNPLPVFSHTVEVTCFLHHDYTGSGLGKKLLRFLETEAADKGIKNILAHISSLNDRSIRFHQKNGFVECGRFVQVGKKNGQVFDMVWMQKRI